MNKRTILLNPGPVTLTDRVRAALAAGDWCHREPEFAALTASLNGRLAGVYPALARDYRSVLLAGSGTAAVEAMLVSFAPVDHRTLVLANGVYGERMGRMLAAHRRPFELLNNGWTAPLDLPAVEARLAGNPDISHVAVVQHETTTGRLNDLAALGRLCKARQVTLLLDAVSSFGAEELAGEDWNVGALAGAANKCLHGVPGLAFVLAPVRAWEPLSAAGSDATDSVYLHLGRYYQDQHGGGYSPFTLPVQLAFALDAALDEFAEAGGWKARGRAYRERASRVRKTLAAAGVPALLPPAECSAALCAYRLPDGLTYAALHDALKAEGFIIYAGQGALAREIFRIAHMGDIRPADLDRLCALLPGILAGQQGSAGQSGRTR